MNPIHICGPVCSLILFVCTMGSVVSQGIILDESDKDWPLSAYSYTDSAGDGNAAGIDFTSCKLLHDETYFYLSVDVGKEINIQDGNFLALWIDVDMNENTGLFKHGIGADFVYFPGERNGRHYLNGSAYNVFHDEAGWVTSPTVTSSAFEISLFRNIAYSGKTIRFGNQIRLVFSDESVAGDRIPNAGTSMIYSFSGNNTFSPRPFSLSKENTGWVRILSYNVLRDNLFQPAVQNSAKRVFQSIRPDIIGFCEIYNNSSSQTAGLVSNWLPPDPGQNWYHSSTLPDIRIVSKYPVINTFSLDGNGAFLLDLKKGKMVVIVMHLPCCDNNVQRQQEVDKIMSFVRAIRFGISPFQVPQNTPVILLGDTNLVGLKQQQETLLNGNIIDNGTFGIDFDPDWDETPLEDAMPVTSNLPFTFTWFNRQGSYSAGRLDYILYTGSVMTLKNSYALWPDALEQSVLSATGLERGDVEKISDHLPVVADFEIEALSNTVAPTTSIRAWDIALYPESIRITTGEPCRIMITNLSGQTLWAGYTQSNLPNEIAIQHYAHANPLLVISCQNLLTGMKQSRLVPVFP